MIKTAASAHRLARTIASDILLYNKEKIAEGIKDDTLFDILADEIAEGHKLYDARVDPSIRDKHNLLERALVDVLIKSSAHLPTDIW
ncbi:hypothetical protein KKF91_13870 [Myxococcota bacterium]|nr:hypothetical protein [Myxococcota bacterium]MBU1431626.1 hypothetical protein [Myxococcota bacterium]MBU1900543.1 hypothetical protein [Myxococcota bacterium]